MLHDPLINTLEYPRNLVVNVDKENRIFPFNIHMQVVHLSFKCMYSVACGPLSLSMSADFYLTYETKHLLLDS